MVAPLSGSSIRDATARLIVVPVAGLELVRNFEAALPMEGFGNTGVVLRNQVTIVQVRASELVAGDVVNRRGPERDGWIEVARMQTLSDGTLLVHDVTDLESFTATGFDLVWLQTLVALETDDKSPFLN